MQKQHVCASQRNGVFMGGFGSLRSCDVQVVKNATFQPKNVYIRGRGPYDILSMTGGVIDGRLHPHLTSSDSKKAPPRHAERDCLLSHVLSSRWEFSKTESV